MKIFVFFAGPLLAYLLMRYRKNIVDFIGTVGFAERYLGMGGTYTFMVILAMGLFVLSMMYVFGALDTILDSTLGRIF